MQLTNRTKRFGAVILVTAGTILTLSHGFAGPFDATRLGNAFSINRHGADNPAGDNRGRGRGHDDPSPTPSPTGTPDDHGHHGPGHP